MTEWLKLAWPATWSALHAGDYLHVLDLPPEEAGKIFQDLIFSQLKNIEPKYIENTRTMVRTAHLINGKKDLATNFKKQQKQPATINQGDQMPKTKTDKQKPIFSRLPCPSTIPEPVLRQQAIDAGIAEADFDRWLTDAQAKGFRDNYGQPFRNWIVAAKSWINNRKALDKDTADACHFALTNLKQGGE